MAGPSLAKHEKDLQKLESHLEKVRQGTVTKEAQYRTQISDLIKQMQDMGRKFNSFATEMRSLTEAMEKAREQETLVDIMEKRHKNTTKNPYKTSTDWISHKAAV
ncbi:hypothetical protein AgCh_012597 [Apium graveolens]